MTNYSTYPKHRLCPNSCIICFENGNYSWCMLNKSQKQYLHDSNYLDGARNIVFMYPSGKTYNFQREEFIKWLEKDTSEKQGEKNEQN